MQLEAVTAELRPRSDWEAVDLGIALVRRDFSRVLACWWVGMLPIVLPGLILLHNQPLLLLLIAWWWTPVASRMVLFYLSRHLFGERPDRKSLLRELPRAIGRRFAFRMLWARFSPWRPLTMPVEDLEGLRGKIYAQRVRLLMRRGDSTLIVVTLWRLVLLIILTVALFQTAVMFIPEGQAQHWQEFLDEWQAGGWMDPPAVAKFAIIAAVLLSMCLTDLFATGIGFGIYVNHRTWIEGWDVEIALRRLGNRLKQFTGMILAAGFLFLFSPQAEAQAQKPEEVIQNIKAQEDFKVHKITVRESKSSPSSSRPKSGTFSFIGLLLQILFWAIAAAVVSAIIFMVYKYRHVFLIGRGSGKRLPKPKAEVAQLVMGMNVTPESLPKDIPAMVLELWQVGRHHEALSLLYRGAISRLIDLAKVEIEESDTESDCLRRVASASPSHEPYFGGLTQAWMRLAYARQTPEDTEIFNLCSSWPFQGERRAS